MADILKIYTAEQLEQMYRLLLLSKGVGLTDFNTGSKIKALIESDSEIISSIQMDFKTALYKAIPIAIYQGFGFAKLAAVSAVGYMRPYRKPALWIKYTGAGTAAKITSNSTTISSTVTGAGGDNFSFAYSSYPTISDIVTAIDGETNWEATLVLSGSIDSTTLYQYTDKDAVGATNYIYTTGLDIMLNTATAITVTEGFSVTLNNLTISTTAETTIAAGESGVQCLSQVQNTGTEGNIALNAIDTLNAKGSIASGIDGIEYVINDSAFSGGKAEETDQERKVRFSETITALNAGTKNGIIAAIRTISGVRSVGMRTSYPFRGTNTIVVDDGTGVISASLLSAVNKVLYGDPNDLTNYPGKNAEGIGYNIAAPVIVAVNVAVTAYRLPNVNVSLTEIATKVQTAIEQYVNTRKLGENVLASEIIRVSKNSTAAVYDVLVTDPSGQFVSISENEFAKTGAGTGGTVTVTTAIATDI